MAVNVAANLHQMSVHPRSSPMTCAAYLDWGFKLKQDGLRDEDLTGLCAQVTNFSLQQLHLLSRSASAHLQQAVYDRVEIDVVLVGHGRRRMITR